MSIVDDDIVSNTSANETLDDVIQARVSRRGAIAGGLAALGGVSALLRSLPASAGGPLLGFAGIAPSSLDEVVVPPGYTAKVLIAWGDPVSNGPEFQQDGSNSAEDQAHQWGMHNDGLVYNWCQRPRRPEKVQLMARRCGGRSPAFLAGRHHEGRRRGHRELSEQSRP